MTKMDEMAEVQGLLGGGWRVLEIQERKVTDKRVWGRTGGSGWELCASEGEASAGQALEASSGLGKDGLFWVAGLADKDRNPRFAPMTARGCRYDHGDYWQWLLSDSDLQGALESKESELLAGEWTIEVPHLDKASKGAKLAAERQVAWLEERINLTGEAWQQHIHEALMALGTGFTVFEQVWGRDGSCDLQWRWPSQVEHWILDEPKSKVLGVQLYDHKVILPKSKMVHYRWGAYGIDPEGTPPLRSLGMLIDMKQQLLRGAAVGFAAFAVPWIAIEESERGTADTGDDGREVVKLSKAQGTDRVVLKLKYGHKIVVVQATGEMPDVIPIVRYLDEKIRQRLRDDAALLGSGGGGGSYALAEQRDGDKLRSSYHIARWLGTQYSEQVIKRMMQRAGKLPLSARQWPRLKYDLGLEDNKVASSDLVALAGAGLIMRTPKVIEQIHTMYGLSTEGLDVAFEQQEAARAAQVEAAKQLGSKDTDKAGGEQDDEGGDEAAQQ